MEQEVKYFNKRSKIFKDQLYRVVVPMDYNRTTYNLFFYIQRMIIFKKFNINDKNVLDYGCGIGRWCGLLEQKGNNTLGVDINDVLLNKARESSGAFNFKNVKNFHYNSYKTIFDYIISLNTLHCIKEKKEVEKILKNFHYMLKEDGKVLIMAFTSKKDYSNLLSLSHEEWVELYENAGFKVRRAVNSEFLFFSHVYRLIFRLFFRKNIMEYYKKGSFILPFHEFFVMITYTIDFILFGSLLGKRFLVNFNWYKFYILEK